ncbi:translation initiation factor eIF2B subunit alpha [Lampetra fluviatilis]
MPQVMDDKGVVAFFKGQIEQDPDNPSAVAAIRTLIHFLKRDTGETLQGLRESLKSIMRLLSGIDASVSMSSCCELFLRTITLTKLDEKPIAECRQILIERGELFLSKISDSRNKIAKMSQSFIRDGATILTHSSSRVVLRVLAEAAASKKRFHVYVTESCPDRSGHAMAQRIRELSVPVTVILDAAVGYIMEQVDLVFVGAEGVVESGGIINKIGTYQMAICAKAQNKPLYVVAESFKFMRLYPLNQQDVPEKYKYEPDALLSNEARSEAHPRTDYTPPAFLTLLITDLGVLTPSAVSDELIQLYV